VLYCKGAPEVVLPRCTRATMNGGSVELADELTASFHTAAEAMAEKGLRVLAFAWRELPESFELANAEAEMTLAGLIGLEDPPRPEVADALQKCRDAGIKVIMVTGDHPQTGTAIAREIGLVRSAAPVVITGEQLGHLSDIQLQLALDAPEIIFARVLAEQKMRIVGALQNKREIVAVTGDGVNDAPALRKADVGIAALQAPIIMMSQNRQEKRDRLRADQDYKVNLKAELEVRLLTAKIDQLRNHQWQRLLEIQKIQTDLMQEILSQRDSETQVLREGKTT